jgi:phage shock protein A
MGLLKRLKTIATADLHDVLDRVEDPIVMLKQHLREMEQDIAKGEEALAKQLFFEKKQEAQLNETQALIKKRVGQAEIAVKKGDDETAKQLILDKIELEKKEKIYASQLEALSQQTKKLVQQMEDYKHKYKELKNKQQLLISRAHVAKVTESIEQSFATFTPGSAVKGFERAEEKILALEVRSKAREMFHPTIDINKVYDYELEEQVQKELDALKNN